MHGTDARGERKMGVWESERSWNVVTKAFRFASTERWDLGWSNFRREFRHLSVRQDRPMAKLRRTLFFS